MNVCRFFNQQVATQVVHGHVCIFGYVPERDLLWYTVYSRQAPDGLVSVDRDGIFERLAGRNEFKVQNTSRRAQVLAVDTSHPEAPHYGDVRTVRHRSAH